MKVIISKITILLFILIALTSTNKISAQEITMFQGFWGMEFYKDDVRISKQQVGNYMFADKAANELWVRSNKHQIYSVVALGAGAACYIWLLSADINLASNGNDLPVAPLIGMVGASVVSAGFQISSNDLKKKSILGYNKSHDISSLELGPTYNGFGLVLSF